MKKTSRGIWVLSFAMSITGVLPAYATEVLFDAKAYYNRGTDLYAKRDYPAAVKALSLAILLEPKAPDAYYNRGLSYRRQQMNDEALSDFSKAIELNQTAARYYFERCNVLIVKNHLNGAIADCSEALRLSPDEAGGYLMRGVAHLLRGDLDEALVDSVQALDIQPDYLDARRLMLETLVKKEAMPGMRLHNASNRPGNPSGALFSGDGVTR